MGADYSFYVKIIETHVRAFLTFNILAIGRVVCKNNQCMYKAQIFAKKCVVVPVKISSPALGNPYVVHSNL